MAAEQLTILELLVDAGPALTEIEKLLPPLTRVAEAAQQAAEGVDRLAAPMTAAAEASARLGASATSSEAGLRRVATAANEQTDALGRTAAEAQRAEQNLIRQSAAADGNVGVTLKLTKQLADLSAAQAEVNQRMQQFGAGSVGKVSGEAELAGLAERSKQTQAAIALLGSGVGSVAEAMQRFPEAFVSSTNSAGQFLAQLERLDAKLNPTAAAAKKMQEELNLLARAEASGVEISIGYGAAREKTAALYDTEAIAAAKLAAAQEKLAETQAKAEAAQTKAGLQSLRTEFDAQAVAVERYEARLVELDKIERSFPASVNMVSQAREKAVQTLSTEINSLAAHEAAASKAATGLHGLAEGEKAVSGSGLSANAILQETEHVARAVFDGVGAGIPVLTALRFEAGRIVEIFGGSLRAVLTPQGLGLAALGGALYLVLSRAAETETNLRTFGVGARTLGTESLASAQDLQKFYERLRDSGVAGAEAKKSIDILRLSPVINPQAIPQITDLAHRLSVLNAEGPTTSQWTEKIKSAMEGGLAPTIKLAESMGLLRGEEAANFIEAARTTGAFQQQQAVFELMLARVPAARESLGGFKQATQELSTAWQQFLDELSNSGPIQAAVNALAGLYKGAAEGIRQLRNEPQATVTTEARIEANRFSNRGDVAGAGPLADIGDALFGGGRSAAEPSASATLPPRIAGSFGGSPNLVDAAAKFLGAGAANANLDSFVKQAANLDPRTAAWCAAFANAVLISQGAAPSGSNVATNFLNYGAGVDATAAQRGDIAVIARGLQAGETGGHVGFFTGESRTGPGGQTQLQVLSGNNAANQVGLNYYNASEVTLRRAADVYGPAIPTGAAANAAGTPPILGVTPGSRADEANILKEREDAIKRQIDLAGQWGFAEQALAEKQRLETDASRQGLGPAAQRGFVEQGLAGFVKTTAAAFDARANQANLETQNALNTASAYRQTEVEGLRAAAAAQAYMEVKRQGGDVTARENQILNQNAATAVSAASQQKAAADVVLARQQQVADATLKGAAAEHEAQIQAQAAAQTHHALADAEAARNPLLIAQAEALQDAAEKQARLNERQREEIELGHQLQQGRDQLQVLQLQSTQVGQLPEVAAKQVSLLREKQLLDEKGIELTEQEKAQRLAQVAAIGDANIKLAEQHREQDRVNDAVRSVADTIDNQIVDAFSSQKAVSWGETMKTILHDLLKQILEFALIKPAIGTALSALGFAQVAQQFGTFGSLGSLGGGGIDPVSGLSNATTSGSSGGLLGSGSILGGLGQIGNTVGGISKLGGLLSGSGESGGGLFSGLGSLFGIGGASTDVGAAIAGTGGLTSQALLDAGTITPTLGVDAFGTAWTSAATETSTALSAAGVESAVSAAGSSIFSTIGSALPYIGVAIAAATLLKGFLGNKKPSTFSSGDVLDLGTGTSSGFSSSGNAQNDATVRSMTASIEQFVKNIGNLTGGTAPTGSLNLVATTKGIEAHYSGELGNINAKFASAQDAVTGIETAILQNIGNVSGTLKTVLAHVTDPSQLQAAVTFAKTYDNLARAADSAFTSLAGDTYQIGPFATALQNLQKTFQDLRSQAEQFGLSLDPINAGLAEATKRLQTDFGNSLDQALNTSAASDYVNQLQAVSKTFATNTQDAQAIGLGGDTGIAAKITQLENQQAAAILGSLSATQLQDVIDKTKQSNPEIAAMAQAILSAGSAAKGAAGSIADLASGIKAIEDLATSLRTGPLSGLSPAKASTAATAAYEEQFRTVLAAGSGVSSAQLSTLAALGQTAIQSSQTAYGQGPQTAALREEILGGLPRITNITGPSTAPLINAANSPALSAIGAAPAVQAAQVTAVLAALHAAGVPGYAGGTFSTAPGVVLVGETGPELIAQPGGLSVTPISAHPGWAWRGGSSSSTSGSIDQEVLAELRALRAEAGALRKQLQGGQIAEGQTMAQQNSILLNIDRKAGPGIVQPMRQRVGR